MSPLAIAAGRASSGIATRATSSAATSMVRCVPMAGISARAELNVPTMAPTVASELSPPLVRPAWSSRASDRRSANGEAMPSSVTGAENSSSVAKNEPATAPMLTAANPRSARSRMGWAMNGSAAVSSAAATRMSPSTRRRG